MTSSVDVHFASTNFDLPLSTKQTPFSTPGPQVSTSKHNQTSFLTHQLALVITDDVILPTVAEEPTSAADVIFLSMITNPTGGVTCIEIPYELSYEQQLF